MARPFHGGSSPLTRGAGGLQTRNTTMTQSFTQLSKPNLMKTGELGGSVAMSMSFAGSKNPSITAMNPYDSNMTTTGERARYKSRLKKAQQVPLFSKSPNKKTATSMYKQESNDDNIMTKVTPKANGTFTSAAAKAEAARTDASTYQPYTSKMERRNSTSGETHSLNLSQMLLSQYQSLSSQATRRQHTNFTR